MTHVYTLIGLTTTKTQMQIETDEPRKATLVISTYPQPFLMVIQISSRLHSIPP